MSKLRDDLFPILQRVGDVPLGGDLAPHADQIVELVREALLAPEAVESTGRKIWEHGGYCNSYENIADSMNRSVRATITAALDAALGGDGHE